MTGETMINVKSNIGNFIISVTIWDNIFIMDIDHPSSILEKIENILFHDNNFTKI